MKNERLMDVLSTVSPTYVAEAAPGNIPRRTGKSPRIVKRLLAVAAVLVLLVAAAVATIGISAEEEQPLQEMPVILLREDFDRLIVQRAEKIEGLVSTHELARLQSMYEHQYLSEAISEKHQKFMLEKFPIVALADIRNLDETISDVETEYYLEILRSIGFTQNDLIECYERMYELVENSDLENKEEILASLPEIPKRPGEE
jgi:hypothetical protein